MSVEIGPLEVGGIAHGGACVARLDGRVIFVRYALPGERVMASVTDDSKARYWRADATRILEPSADRVTPVCPVFTMCGGCDFQHAASAAQRRLKADIVAEQLRRLAGIERDVEVIDAGGHLGWRTRMGYLVDDGKVGLRGRRSHELVALPDGGCPIAHPAGRDIPNTDASSRLDVVVSDDGVSVLADGAVVTGHSIVTQHCAGRRYRVAASGFWQVHPRAAELLVSAVLDRLEPQAGELALDLYCGVGLFAGALASRGVAVHGVELSRRAIGLARKNVPEATFSAGKVERMRWPHRRDLVILDPPRTGAGAQIVRRIAGLEPRAIAYVSCDPASLARDLKTFDGLGYRIASLTAFDLFPQTSHIECVVLLSRE